MFSHDWESVTQAIWLKYPNPYSRHVHSQDILSRFVDPSTGILHTKRLIVKSGSVPQWLAAIFGKRTSNKTEALVVEDSKVDICARQMETVTRNVNHRKWMVVEERVEYTGLGDNQTEISTQATFRCSLKYNLVIYCGRYLSGRLEGLGLSRFSEHLNKSKQALLWILEQLQRHKRIKGG